MKKEYLSMLKRMFVVSGEYKFVDEVEEFRFLKRVLSDAEDMYSDEHFYREFKDFKDFLYTHHVDAIAHFTSDDYELVD